MQSYLHLADGTILEGKGFGYASETDGEVVFSTGMTGYVKSLTDPSFSGQILTFTYPLLGNYGVPKPIIQDTHLLANLESEKIWVKGVVVSSFADMPSHYDNFMSFDSWLTKEKVPGIWGIDTRALTQKIREHGVLQGRISAQKNKVIFQPLPTEVVPEVSLKEVVTYTPQKSNKKHIAVLDCGVKHGILRELLRIGYTVTRVPFDVNPLSLKTKFDGVLCSNGPGDPKDCEMTIANIREILKTDMPFLGICLGHQLLSLAIGADTYKLKYGHRGLNQPCQDIFTQKAYVTSQNHGYAVERKSIPKDFEEWFINLNDGTVEGLRHKKKNVKSVQFHPEGNPGPYDTRWIYDFV